jgi:hypothetical protein
MKTHIFSPSKLPKTIRSYLLTINNSRKKQP